MVKSWSSTRDSDLRAAAKPLYLRSAQLSRWRPMATVRDAPRADRTQEVAGSSPASSIAPPSHVRKLVTRVGVLQLELRSYPDRGRASPRASPSPKPALREL